MNPVPVASTATTLLTWVLSQDNNESSTTKPSSPENETSPEKVTSRSLYWVVSHTLNFNQSYSGQN